MFETVYHGVPIVTIPVFCDHDSNAAKAEVDGYAKKLELGQLTSDSLYKAITEVINEPKYKIEVKKRQFLLRDQKESPLERAVYWTEYVMRHKGAYHLQSPAKDLNFFQYFMLDVIFIASLILITLFGISSYILRVLFNKLLSYVENKQVIIEKSNGLLKRSKILMDQTTISKKKL
jgi:hypothetical protein